MRKPRKSPKRGTNVIVKPLGQYRFKGADGKRHSVVGLYFSEGSNSVEPDTILVDPRQTEQGFLNTLIHETLHRLCPAWSENKVKKCAGHICAVIWEQGYRKER